MIKISVIVPTYNRAEYLLIMMASVCKQNYDSSDYEVLVVDNGSTDRTRAVIEDTVKEYPAHNIRYIYESKPGLLSGRHRGALEAKGEILVFVDDDIEADKGWLKAIVETFAYPTVQLVGGRNLPKYEVQPPEWLSWFWYKHSLGRVCGDLSVSDFGGNICKMNPIDVWGLNFSIRRSALFDLGGFHPDCMSKHFQHFQGDGETGLTRKALECGYRAVYQPQALVYHHVSANRMTYEAFEQKRYYQGICNSFSDIRKQYGKDKIKKRYSSSLKDRAKALLLEIKWRINKLIDPAEGRSDIPFLPNENVDIPERRRLMKRMEEAYLAGYNFHQEAVKDSPDLLKWVLKDDYWDYKLPDLIEVR